MIYLKAMRQNKSVTDAILINIEIEELTKEYQGILVSKYLFVGFILSFSGLATYNIS